MSDNDEGIRVATTDDRAVPDVFAQAGFTGLFRTTAAMDAAATKRFASEAPCLLGNSGWMVLAVEQHDDYTGTATLVRRDDAALADVFGLTR